MIFLLHNQVSHHSNQTNSSLYLYLNQNHYLNLNPYQYQLRHRKKAGMKQNWLDFGVRKTEFGGGPMLKAPISDTLTCQLQRPLAYGLGERA